MPPNFGPDDGHCGEPLFVQYAVRRGAHYGFALEHSKAHLVSKPWFFMFLQSLEWQGTRPYSGVNKVVFWGVLGGWENPNIFRMPFRQNSNMFSWLSWLSFVVLFELGPVGTKPRSLTTCRTEGYKHSCPKAHPPPRTTESQKKRSLQWLQS